MATTVQPPPVSPAEDAGGLGVVYLKRFWSQTLRSQMGAHPIGLTENDGCAQNVLLAGLKLGIRETLDFLASRVPSFDTFEAWVLAKNDGSLSPARVERLNGALRGDTSFVLESIDSEPALSASDLAFWDQNGYVVLKQAISPDQCRAAVQAIFEFSGIDIERPDTWYTNPLWIPLAHHPALWANRNARRIHTAFSQIWKRNDLWMNVDVCGVNPPERPGYKFSGTPLHWDMTLAPPIRFATQGLLYLTDTAANQGAFSCVPGFHRKLTTWLSALPPDAEPRNRALNELQAVPIAGEAGDLIIWHQALPHGATPNRAALPRVVQYLNMFPSRYEINPEWV